MLASRHFGKFAHLPDDSRAKDNNEKSIPWNISQPKKSWKCGLWTFLWAVSTNFYPFSVPFISISDTVLKSLSPCSNCKNLRFMYMKAFLRFKSVDADKRGLYPSSTLPSLDKQSIESYWTNKIICVDTLNSICRQPISPQKTLD